MAELGIASSGIRIDHDNNALIKLLEIDRIGPVKKYAMRAYSIRAIHGYNIKDQFSSCPHAESRQFLFGVASEGFAAFT